MEDRIVCASMESESILVESVELLSSMRMLLHFSTGEVRLYDAKQLLVYPAFKSLEDEQVFRTARVDHGVVVWADGAIDIAPEAMYKDSTDYHENVR